MGGVFEAWMHVAWAQCWQITLLILAVWLAVRFTARNRPHLASVLWLVVLIKCVTPPLWSSPSSIFSWLQVRATMDDSSNNLDLHSTLNDAERLANHPNEIVVQMPRGEVAHLLPAEVSLDTNLRARSAREQILKSITSSSGILILTWLIGCLGFACIAFVRGFLCWSRLRRAGTADAPEVVQLAARLSQQLGLKWPVRVIVSRSPVGPAVVGMLRPTVILPSLIVDAKTLAELEPLLAHEMIHIRRGDLWIGLLQLLAQGLWWFHPLVRMVNQLATREAERCCDEEVIARLGCEPGQYARSLIDVLALKRTLQPIPAFPGVRPVDVTSQRLERIMKLGQGCHRRTPRWCWLVMLLAVAITLPGAALIVADDQPSPTALPKTTIETPIPNPTLVVSAPPAADATSDSVFVSCVYDVSDLIERYRQQVVDSESEAKQAIHQRLRQVTEPQTPEPQLEPHPAQSIDVKKLAPNDFQHVWDQSRLLVRCRSSAHSILSAELRRLREDGFAQIQVEVRIISGEPVHLDRLWLSLQPLKAAESAVKSGKSAVATYTPAPAAKADAATVVEALRTPLNQTIQGSVASVIERQRVNRVAVIDAEQARQIIQDAQQAPRLNVLFAPRILLFNGQQASITDQVQRPFVVGIERQNNESKAVIKVLSEGWQMSVRPRLLDPRKKLFNLNFDVSLSEIVAVKTVPFPGDPRHPDAVVQCPEVESTRVNATLELKENQTLVIGDLSRRVPGNEERPFLLLVSVKQAVPEAVAQKNSQPNPTGTIQPVAANQIEQTSGTEAALPPTTKQARDAAAANDPRRKSRPQEDPETAPLEVRVYNVADLVIPVPDAKLNRSRNKEPGSNPNLQAVKVDFDPLEDLIFTTIAPASWDRLGGRGSLKSYETTISLVVRQTRAVHEELQDLLGQIRTLQDLQVSFALEPIKLTQADYKAWIDRADGPGIDRLKSKKRVLAVALSSPDAKALRRASNGDNSVPVLKLTLMNGQQSELQVAKDDAKAEGVIAWMQLLPSIMPELQRVRVNVAAGLSDHSESLEKQSELVTLAHGESLLVDIAADRWSAVEVTRPISVLDKVPYVDQLFKIAADEPKPVATHRQFYLLTPKVMLVREAEEAPAWPATRQ